MLSRGADGVLTTQEDPMTWTRFLSPEARDTIFDLVVHVVWADGRLSPDELAGARGAARALGLSEMELGGVLLARAGRPFESLALSALGPLERPFAYGVAAWISQADRRVTVSGDILMRRLRQSLQLSTPLAEAIESWAGEERGGACEAPDHQLELERVMHRIVRSLIGDVVPRGVTDVPHTPPPPEPPDHLDF